MITPWFAAILARILAKATSTFPSLASVEERVTEHHQPCSGCLSFIEIGNEISREGYMRLNKEFSVSNLGQRYNSTHAKRKLLQISLAAIKI